MLVFDFDGVIADSLALCTAACRFASDRQNGPSIASYNPFETLNPVTFEALGETLGLAPDIFAKDVAHYVTIQSEPTSIFLGIPEMLMVLSKGAAITVLSATATSVIERFTNHHGISDAIHQIIGGDQPGGKPEKLSRLVSSCHDEPNVMIGDSISDVVAAQHADIPCIGVAWGWQPADRLSAAGAEAVAQRPDHLQDLLTPYLAKTGKTVL